MTKNYLQDTPGIPDPSTAAGTPRLGLCLILIIGILLTTALIRTVNLNADPVSWYTDEVGYQIDEGYKTLSPRNLSLFSVTHWNPADQYTGWMESSAITQWPYYWAFKVMGVKLGSARAVSIIYAVLFLAFASVILWKRVPPMLAVFGILLLASDPALFMFSRSALFETALVFFTYAGIFLAVLVPSHYKRLSALPIICLAIPTMFYLKMTAIVYMGPPALCLLFVSLRDNINPSKNRIWYVLALLIVAGIILYTHQAEWVHKFSLWETIAKPQRLFLNPVHMLSPLVLIVAYTILLELLIIQPRSILEDGYRLSLASIVIVVPIALSFFIINQPPRYYIPVIPAALLLLIERLSMSIPHGTRQKFTLLSINTLLAAIVLMALTMTIALTLNYYLISNLPIKLGTDPGLSIPAIIAAYPLFLILFIGFIVFIARRYWSGLSTNAYKLFAALHILIGLGMSITAVAYPHYQSHQIRDLITEHVKQDESIGGDWAPFFVVESSYRVLYMRPDTNNVEIIRELRPDYFLSSDTPYDQKTFTQLKLNKDIKLGNPIELGTFAGHNISLHSIEYLE